MDVGGWCALFLRAHRPRTVWPYLKHETTAAHRLTLHLHTWCAEQQLSKRARVYHEKDTIEAERGARAAERLAANAEKKANEAERNRKAKKIAEEARLKAAVAMSLGASV